ncbi:hypothetical protein [Planktosalinus lacus]|uniref:Uncharacterized protein n=1 Tax=Planktosalinus lacus TaxID=1526573 RepID=A0A8J2YBI8_9FLAO|nr:hypothetical protein [Planktosalinus lacus]GGD99546.1 hypothetical protein GCM10011312_23740 [Planktosalinus lacus]
MKKYYLYLLCILTLSSCQYKADNTNAYKVDNTNAYKIGAALYEGILRDNNEILKELFIHQMDSLSKQTIEELNNAKAYLKKNKNVQLFKIDTTDHSFAGGISIFLKKGKVFYEILGIYKPDSTKHVKLTHLTFKNINEQCERDKKEPYTPISRVVFKKLIWTTDFQGKTFKSGAIELQNYTGLDINYIKFRVKLKQIKSYRDTEFFYIQTVESQKTIYKGDIAIIEIPGMTEYYAGFKIDEDEFLFEPELIEVKPKPEPESYSYWCEFLKDFEKEVNEKNI